MGKKINLSQLNSLVKCGNNTLKHFHSVVKEINYPLRKSAQLVRVTNSKGVVQEGFFNNIEISFSDNKLECYVVINPIIEMKEMNMIMASTHKNYIHDALTIEPYNHRKYKHNMF